MTALREGDLPHDENLVVMTVMKDSTAYHTIKDYMDTNHKRGTRTMLWEVINHLFRKKTHYTRMTDAWDNPVKAAHDLNWELIGAEVMRQIMDDDMQFGTELLKYNQKQREYGRDLIHWIKPGPSPADQARMAYDMAKPDAEQTMVIDYGPCYDLDTMDIPTPKTQLGEIPMSHTTPTYETKHFVDGRDVSTMPDHELISAICRLESEIESLGKIKTESKMVAKKITEAEKGIKFIVKHLDKRA